MIEKERKEKFSTNEIEEDSKRILFFKYLISRTLVRPITPLVDGERSFMTKT